MPSQQDVITVLKTIFDPEIPVDIYELGLIYEVKFTDAEGGQKVDVQMTLTSPNCPVAESLPNDVKNKVASMEGVTGAEDLLERKKKQVILAPPPPSSLARSH